MITLLIVVFPTPFLGTNVVYNGILEKWDIMANQDISVVGNDIDE